MNNCIYKMIIKNNNIYIFNLLVIVVLENFIINKFIIIYLKGVVILDNFVVIV